MNRNERFQALEVTDIAARTAWASLTIQADDVQDIQVLVAGTDEDAAALRITCAGGLLTVEQPNLGLKAHPLSSERWMQITLRLPRSWKGALEAGTVTAPLQVTGFTGTDLTLSTVSGPMQARGVQSISTTLRTVSGSMTASDLAGEKLSIRTVSGTAALEACAFGVYRLSSVSGGITLTMQQGFERLDAATVSGPVTLHTPLTAVDAALRTVTGQLITDGVKVESCASVARMTSVSGPFAINCSQPAAIYEEE